MPYITKDKRPTLETFITRINTTAMDWELNDLIRDFLIKTLDLADHPKYSKFVTALGTIECVKQELSLRKMLWRNGQSVAVCPVPGLKQYSKDTALIVDELAQEIRRRALFEDGCIGPNMDGELNFCIFRLLVTRFKLWKHGVNVSTLLENAGRQLYAEYGFPYECKKKKENGDVF